MGKVQQWWIRVKVSLVAVAGLIGLAWLIFWSGMRRGREDVRANEETKKKLDRIDKQVKERDNIGLREDGIKWGKKWDR